MEKLKRQEKIDQVSRRLEICLKISYYCSQRSSSGLRICTNFYLFNLPYGKALALLILVTVHTDLYLL